MKCPGLHPSGPTRPGVRRESAAGLWVFLACLGLGVLLALHSRTPDSPRDADPHPNPRVSRTLREDAEPCCPRPGTAAPVPPVQENGEATFRGDSGLSGVFAGEAPSAPVGVRWRVATGGTPAGGLVWDGRRFLVALAEGAVIAVTPEGRELWRRGAALDGIAGPPAVVKGRCIVASPSGTFAAFQAATGDLLWRFSSGIDFHPRSAPVPAGDLLVAVSQSDGRLMALDSATGTMRWAAPPLSRCDGPPSVAGGWILYGHCDAAIQIQDVRSGDSVGTVSLGPNAQVAGGVAVRGDWACFGTRNGQVVLVHLPSRDILWKTSVGEGEVFSTPVLTDRLAVVTDSNAVVTALDTTEGRVLWRYDTHQRSATSPILVGGSVVLGAAGTVLALDLQTGQALWSLTVGDATTEPVAARGLVVLGTDEGDLVAIGSRTP